MDEMMRKHKRQQYNIFFLSIPIYTWYDMRRISPRGHLDQ